jgi:hypothetical protein
MSKSERERKQEEQALQELLELGQASILAAGTRRARKHTNFFIPSTVGLGIEMLGVDVHLKPFVSSQQKMNKKDFKFLQRVGGCEVNVGDRIPGVKITKRLKDLRDMAKSTSHRESKWATDLMYEMCDYHGEGSDKEFKLRGYIKDGEKARRKRASVSPSLSPYRLKSPSKSPPRAAARSPSPSRAASRSPSPVRLSPNSQRKLKKRKSPTACRSISPVRLSPPSKSLKRRAVSPSRSGKSSSSSSRKH